MSFSSVAPSQTVAPKNESILCPQVISRVSAAHGCLRRRPPARRYPSRPLHEDAARQVHAHDQWPSCPKTEFRPPPLSFTSVTNIERSRHLFQDHRGPYCRLLLEESQLYGISLKGGNRLRTFGSLGASWISFSVLQRASALRYVFCSTASLRRRIS